MNEAEDRLGKLRTLIEAGRDRFNKDSNLNFKYVTGVVVPKLQDALSDVCLEIEQHHRLSKSETKSTNFVVHYTSVATIVSMLQAYARKERGNPLNGEQRSLREEQGISLRIYDSAHFNDPDEGNYLVRNLNLPEKHSWLNINNVTHAYIASFIIPETDPNVASDNLVFWRTYGREGEGCSLKLNIPSSSLQEVHYGPKPVNRTAQIMLPVLEVLHPLVSIDEPSIRQVVQEAFWGSLGKIQYLYKSQAYAYERECRFVITRSNVGEDRICFDYTDEGNLTGRLRHYCEDEALEVRELFPTGSSITLGPCVSDKNDLRRSLEVLKRRANLSGPEIKFSEIHYRRS